MLETILTVLRCPIDKGTLEIVSGEKETDGHILSGHLTCSSCSHRYEILDGVPVMLPRQSDPTQDRKMERLQEETMQRFGFEWKYFNDWGWLEDYPDIPQAEEKFLGGLKRNSVSAYWSKSLFNEEDLAPGQWVLDAGCGNGRFSYQTAKTGANVVGIDLGAGVHSAFQHLRSYPNVHIVQGDLLRLPFAEKFFDRIFSIGVLMHTGDAPGAFDSLVQALKPGGLIVAHVYGKGRFSYEFIDKVLRSITTRVPISAQLRFSRWMAGIARWLRTGGETRSKMYKKLYRHINLLPTEHHMFDWWSAPIATHHTIPEVTGWFEKNNLQILRTNPPFTPADEILRKKGHYALTALGILAAETSGPDK